MKTIFLLITWLISCILCAQDVQPAPGAYPASPVPAYSGSKAASSFKSSSQRPHTFHSFSADTMPVIGGTISIAANPQLKGGGLKRMFMGGNYREEWTTPVTVEVLDMGREQGGLTPTKQGGGKQTRSLRLEDPSGKEWVLRSVKKFPEAAVPPDLRSQFAIDVVEDGISASYPFASLSIQPFANAAGVPFLRRKLVFIPDDPRLGEYQETFRNTLAVLEEREPQGIDKTYNTEELVMRLADDNNHHVEQVEVLKARLLDNFYMDFDRHEDQWRWATRDTGRGKLYYPIPRDQDQAFYINEGIIPYFVKKPWLVPELQGFDIKTDNIKTFNKPARNFDRYFLNELEDDVWEREIDSFLSRMTDSVIYAALNQQPAEVRNFRYQKLTSRLMEKRNHFRKDMMEYYRFLARRVNIVATNQRELIIIDGTGGNVRVTLQKINNEGAVEHMFYDRSFNPSVTKELRLYGMGDADSFIVRGNIPIKMRIIGGPGNDHFHSENGTGNIRVYDVLYEENSFSGNHQAFRKKLNSDPRNNAFDRIYYNYNIFHPGLTFAYNIDDGLFLGARAEYTRHGFRKEPYAMRHSLAAGHALRTSSWFFNYMGEINRFIGKNDLVLNADIRAPVNVTNFFGFGNNTGFDKSRGIQYYRARYDITNASILVRRQMQSWMRLMFGGSFQTFRLDPQKNEGRFVNDPSVNGLDPKNMHNRKTYAGGELAVDISTRNSPVLPTRGFTLNAGVRHLFDMRNNSSDLTQLRGDMSVIASLASRARLVLASRVGLHHNIGDFEFPQANYLSGVQNLRGYRRDRFAGRTMAFNNTELRLKLGDFTTYLFPGSIGLLAFHDIGRVWVDHEQSDTWHSGYGGGIWIAPIQRFVLTVSVATSSEEKLLPYFRMGFQF